MKSVKNLIGQRYGKLVVIRQDENHKSGRTAWVCKCDCGGICSVNACSLQSGLTKSCGCLRAAVAAKKATRHGGAKDPLYFVLNMMHQRCENPGNKDFAWYGAKGVTVCEEWALSNYPAFRAWAEANGYAPGLTIDRIDPTGPYSPDNCRWIPIQEQQRNKRKTKRIDAYAHD